MFDGVPDQFHQFIASSAAAAAVAATRTTALPLPLSFPPSLHLANSSNGFTSFDTLFTSNSQPPQLQQQQPHFLHPLLQPQKNEQKEENTGLVGMNMEIERERSMAAPIDTHPWSNDEVLALLRIRSSMENWFPEFTWEHVSRKLAELGFKRSAEKCKEKFEEESRYFNSINCSKNYRLFSELEELCQGDENPPPPPPPPPPPHHHSRQAVGLSEKNKSVEKSREDEDNMGQNLEDDSRNVDEYQAACTAGGNNNASEDNEKVVAENNKADYNKNSSNRKRKRSQKKFEMIKGFCEDIVNKLMSQQEEMHNKLLEDMVKRDEEKVAREEAWKKQELDRINQELELRAKEQAVAGDRQATIIKFLSKFAPSTGSSKSSGRNNEAALVNKVPINDSNPTTTSSSLVPAQNPNPIANNQTKVDQLSSSTTSMTENQALQNPNPRAFTSSSAPQNPNSVTPSLTVNNAAQNPTSIKEDLGKRWPRDEVLALINLRCNLYNNGDHDKEGSSSAMKAPLWERISQRMLELGYKRSAKRCKEKWENINKYFRKTKDVNKKRSIDSRTCPYFHQLSTLYNQGTIMSENCPTLPEYHSDLQKTDVDDNPSQRRAKDSTVQFCEGETNMVEVPAFEFEF